MICAWISWTPKWMNASKSQERCSWSQTTILDRIFDLRIFGIYKKIPNKDVFKQMAAVLQDVCLWLKTTGQSAMKITQELELSVSIEDKFFRIIYIFETSPTFFIYLNVYGSYWKAGLLTDLELYMCYEKGSAR